MRFDLPEATRIDGASLLGLLFLPCLAGMTLAVAIQATAPDMIVGGSGVGALAMIKLCYLGTAASHFAAWMADRTLGGPGTPGWRDGDWQDLPVRVRSGIQETKGGQWGTFPNGIDGAILALGLTTLINLLSENIYPEM